MTRSTPTPIKKTRGAPGLSGLGHSYLPLRKYRGAPGLANYCISSLESMLVLVCFARIWGSLPSIWGIVEFHESCLNIRLFS